MKVSMLLELLCSLPKEGTTVIFKFFQHLGGTLSFYSVTFEDYAGSNSKKENVSENVSVWFYFL